jgi:hypothetical protein
VVSFVPLPPPPPPPGSTNPPDTSYSGAASVPPFLRSSVSKQ